MDSQSTEDVTMSDAPSPLESQCIPPTINIIPAPEGQDASQYADPETSISKQRSHPRWRSENYLSPSDTPASRLNFLPFSDLNPAGSVSLRIQKHPATFQCTLCPKRFTRAYNLRSHLRTHTDERPFVCTVCGKAFARQHDRKRHEGLHQSAKMFVCKGKLTNGGQWGCGRSFARAEALGRHFRSEAGRICIHPLLLEEASKTDQPTSFESLESPVHTIPAAILAQYPALQSFSYDMPVLDSDTYHADASNIEDDATDFYSEIRQAYSAPYFKDKSPGLQSEYAQAEKVFGWPQIWNQKQPQEILETDQNQATIDSGYANIENSSIEYRTTSINREEGEIHGHERNLLINYLDGYLIGYLGAPENSQSSSNSRVKRNAHIQILAKAIAHSPKLTALWRVARSRNRSEEASALSNDISTILDALFAQENSGGTEISLNARSLGTPLVKKTPILDSLTGEPFIYISKNSIPVFSSTIPDLREHLQGKRWHDIRADETGYFIFFEDSTQGRRDCQQCYHACNRSLFFTYTMHMECWPLGKLGPKYFGLDKNENSEFEKPVGTPDLTITNSEQESETHPRLQEVSNNNPLDFKQTRHERLDTAEENQPIVDKTASIRADPSDSGYHSGIGTDTESVCSIGSMGSSLGLPHDFLQDFIALFGDTLINETRVWVEYALAKHSPELIEQRLRGFLKDYAIDLLSGQQSMQRDEVQKQPKTGRSNDSIALATTRLLRRYRPKIARYFRDHAVSTQLTPESMFLRLQELSKQFSLTERLSLLDKVAAVPKDIEVEDDNDNEEDNIDIEDEYFQDLAPIQEFLISGKEFQNLAKAMRRDLYFDEKASMDQIKHQMLEQLHGKDCKKHESQYNICFTVAWNLQEFLKSQFENEIPRIGSVVTLTGSALYAQATTCSKYLETTWPRSGSLLLSAMEAVLNKMGEWHSTYHAVSAENLNFSITMLNQSLLVDAYGSEDMLVELVQQFAWMGSTLRASPYDENLAYHKAKIQPESTSLSFSMSFESEPLHPTEQSCWFPLFCGASIARDFPIPDRDNEPGLEIPLDILAGITGVRHAIEYEGGVVMKGFSSMLVPTRRQTRTNVVQWHLISSSSCESRLSYREVLELCPNRATLEEVDLECLRNTRAIVGWCSAASSLLGSGCVNYDNIDYSGAEEVDSSTRVNFNGGSFGFQQFGVAQLDFSLGAKEGKCHFQRKGPYKRIITAAEKTPVVLYDTSERRGWLVPACEVILHMAHHRNSLDPFEINSEEVKQLTTGLGRSSAKDLLLKGATLDISDCENYKFRDLIINIWSILEFLIDQNVRTDRIPGAKVTGKFQDSIQGFEFKAVVEERSPFRRKKTTIEKTCGGWPALVRDIDALVLFAKGYEDVIRPVRQSTDQFLCHVWRDVPKWKDYLAASVKTLNDLFEVAGCRLDRTYLTSTHLKWHRGNSLLFEACDSVGQNRCQCNRLQQIVPKSAVGAIIGPGLLIDDGAVIFGKSDSPMQELFATTKTTKQYGLYSQRNISILPQSDGEFDEDDTHSSTCSDSEPSTRSGSDMTSSTITSISRSSFRGVTASMTDLDLKIGIDRYTGKRPRDVDEYQSQDFGGLDTSLPATKRARDDIGENPLWVSNLKG